jgi:hypothetical protein
LQQCCLADFGQLAVGVVHLFFRRIIVFVVVVFVVVVNFVVGVVTTANIFVFIVLDIVVVIRCRSYK